MKPFSTQAPHFGLLDKSFLWQPNCSSDCIQTSFHVYKSHSPYHVQKSLSAYEVKNNCCLSERHFKVKKNGVFLFGISFFPFGDIHVLYANEESDDVMGSSTETAQHSNKNNSRNIKAVFFKLGTNNVHHKWNRMTPTKLLQWQHPRLQFLSVKNQISQFATF